jgi:predicted dinucleotide-binding enzyme
VKIAVVGAGKVGSALGGRWSESGHDVTYGVRDPSDPKYQRLDAERRSIKEAVAAADVVVIAVPWREVEGPAGELDDLGDRVVLDATNPLAGGPQGAGFTSGAENIAV